MDDVPRDEPGQLRIPGVAPPPLWSDEQAAGLSDEELAERLYARMGGSLSRWRFFVAVTRGRIERFRFRNLSRHGLAQASPSRS